MSTGEPPAETGDEKAAQTKSDDQGCDDSDDSVVAPPAYPAYSTPPPRGLHTGEDG
jgi:hypothetical protein